MHRIRKLRGLTYGKLANLGIINTQNLILFGSTQAQTGNEVHDEQDNAGTDKGVGKSSDGVGKLVTELNVVVVDPATGDHGNTVKVRDVVTRSS